MCNIHIYASVWRATTTIIISASVLSLIYCTIPFYHNKNFESINNYCKGFIRFRTRASKNMYDIIFEIVLARLFFKIIYCLYSIYKYTTVYKHNNDNFYSTILILCSIPFFNVMYKVYLWLICVRIYKRVYEVFYIFYNIIYLGMHKL